MGLFDGFLDMVLSVHMRAFHSLALVLLLLPAVSFASTITTGRTLVLSEPTPGNAYLAGTDITIAAPQSGDVLALGATVVVSAPVTGDVMALGGTVGIHKPVTGDVRVVAASLQVDAPISGDFVAAANELHASTTAKDTHLAGGTVELIGSSTGAVNIYASDITLTGDYQGDVTLNASNSITLGPGTHIHGALNYNAPQQLTLPDGVRVDGGVHYTGSSSFLPTNQQAQTFAVAGASILFLVHLLAVLVLAGIIAGLFPKFTELVAERSLEPSSYRFVLLTLLGFALLVATPVLILILLLSFVGIGVALFLIPLYLLFFMLAYVYAGILTGTLLARTLLKRSIITWKEGVVGMLVFYLIGIVPTLGPLLKAVLIMVAGGTIASIAFTFTFRRSEGELPLE